MFCWWMVLNIFLFSTYFLQVADSSVGLDFLVDGWFPKYSLFMAVSMKYFFQIIT